MLDKILPAIGVSMPGREEGGEPKQFQHLHIASRPQRQQQAEHAAGNSRRGGELPAQWQRAGFLTPPFERVHTQ
jgi:hypothetical protein